MPKAIELLNSQKASIEPTIDIVVPVFGEKPEALSATLSACVAQTQAIDKVFVVDDGSLKPVPLPQWAECSAKIVLIRLSQNQGIAAARNTGIARSTGQFLACINVEVLPAPDWLSTCMTYLSKHPDVGACFTRLIPEFPNALLPRWRMRFQEPVKYGEFSGAAPFAPGHAVLFRRESIYAVCGYDDQYRRRHEDSDICARMRRAGWDTHYVSESYCVSIQSNSLSELSKKQLRDSDWFSANEYSLFRLFFLQCRWLFVRMGRNFLRGRFLFLLVDLAIWARSLQMAAVSTFRFWLGNKGLKT